MAKMNLGEVPDDFKAAVALRAKQEFTTAKGLVLRVVADYMRCAPEIHAMRTADTRHVSPSNTGTGERPDFAGDERKEADKYPGQVREVWGYYMQAIGKNPKLYTLTPRRMTMGIRRLKDLAQREIAEENRVKVMVECVKRMKASPFHNGENDRHKKYLDWDHLFDSTERMEKWLNQ
jgi:hypothetical protein